MDSDNLSMYLEKEGWLKYTSTFFDDSDFDYEED